MKTVFAIVAWSALVLMSSVELNSAFPESERSTSNDKLIIYPNPATTEVNIEYEDEHSSTATISIEDQQGKKLVSFSLKGKSQHTLQLDRRFVEGNYYVTLNRNGKKLTSSFSVRE